MRKSRLTDELIRCGRDPIYFIDNHVKIRHPTRGLIPFKLFDCQHSLLESFISSRHNVVNKARQMGISELTAAFILWLIMFHSDQSVLVMATKAETAKNMIKKVLCGYQHLPRWLKFSELSENNKFSLAFSNGSWVKATTKSADAGRSEALSLLVIDEAAHIQGFDDIWVSIKPTVTAGGRVVMISTPNGVGNVFQRTYADAESGNSKDWRAHEFPWWLHPEHVHDLQDDPERPGRKTSSWYKQETSDLSDREKSQEYECSFLSSGDTFIAGELLIKIGERLSVPIDVQGDDKGLLIFQNKTQHGKYLLTADVARGDGRDKSSAHVFDIETMEQVAEYDGKISVDKFAKLICDLGWEYNKALLVVENLSVGFAVLEHVRLWKQPDTGAEGYPNVYFTDKTPGERGQALNAAYGVNNPKLVIGFTTSTKTRELAINKLEELLRLQKMHFRSKRTHSELQTFVWNGGKPEARSGANDDLVMAGAIAAWIRDTFIGTSYHTMELQAKILQSYSVSTRKNTEIHGASKDPTVVPRHAMGTFARVSPADIYRLRVQGQGGREVDVDLRQLIDGYRPKIFKG